MSLWSKRAGRFDDIPSTSIDFAPNGIAAGTTVYGTFFGGVPFEFVTTEHMTAEQLCDYIDAGYPAYLTSECGLDWLELSPTECNVLIGR